MIGRASWGQMGCERSDDGGAGGGGPMLWKIIRRAARLCWSKLHRQKQRRSQGGAESERKTIALYGKGENRVGDATTRCMLRQGRTGWMSCGAKERGKGAIVRPVID
jgi:hypothetical protein